MAQPKKRENQEPEGSVRWPATVRIAQGEIASLRYTISSDDVCDRYQIDVAYQQARSICFISSSLLPMRDMNLAGAYLEHILKIAYQRTLQQPTQEIIDCAQNFDEGFLIVLMGHFRECCGLSLQKFEYRQEYLQEPYREDDVSSAAKLQQFIQAEAQLEREQQRALEARMSREFDQAFQRGIQQGIQETARLVEEFTTGTVPDPSPDSEPIGFQYRKPL